MNESPEKVYGRLSEAVHATGYHFERACSELEWLLEEERWKQCGDGFERIDDFLATVNFSEFKIAVEQRKKLAKKLTDMRATQRAIAKTIGVHHTTITKDLQLGENSPKTNNQVREYKELGIDVGENSPKSIIQKSGAEVIQNLKQKAHVSYNTGENEWYTPVEYIEAAKNVMGNIDLDPASSDEANEIIKANKYYSIEDDGLQKEWHGKIWMNPPYASELIGKFSIKLIEELINENVKEAIVLVNNATDTKWLQNMMKYCNAICFPVGRIHFWNISNKAASPLQGQAILYFGENVKSFNVSFKIFGKVFYSSNE